MTRSLPSATGRAIPSGNSDASDMRDNDMVELVAVAISRAVSRVLPYQPESCASAAKAALEASHYAEMVSALYLALDCLQVSDPEREHPRTAEAIRKVKKVLKSLPRRVGWEVQYTKRPDGSLREIGGDA